MIRETDLPRTFRCGECSDAGYVIAPMPLPPHRKAQGVTEVEWSRQGYTHAAPCVSCERGQRIAAGHWRRYIHDGDLKQSANPERASEFLDAMLALGVRGERIKQFFDRVES